MSVGERDPITGYMTTGHDWNGITELNSPVPKVVVFFLAATTLFAIVGWIFLPAWPSYDSFTKGLWRADQTADANRALARIVAKRAGWEKEIATRDFAAIRADPALMARVQETAPALFGQNCQVCHGPRGVGGPGFPRLQGDFKVWGKDAEAIAETIKVGVNSANPDSRMAQMPAFGRGGMLKRPDLDILTTYVQSLSTGVAGSAEGKKLFDDNCAACHGEDAHGVEGTGALNLTDSYWLYGGDAQSILTTLIDGRQGQMPSWASRLDPTDIRILALYVEGLGKVKTENAAK